MRVRFTRGYVAFGPGTRLWRKAVGSVEKIYHGAMRLLRVPLQTEHVVTNRVAVIFIVVSVRKRDRVLGQARDAFLVKMIETSGRHRWLHPVKLPADMYRVITNQPALFVVPDIATKRTGNQLMTEAGANDTELTFLDLMD